MTESYKLPKLCQKKKKRGGSSSEGAEHTPPTEVAIKEGSATMTYV
jgi:hypothetical protein